MSALDYTYDPVLMQYRDSSGHVVSPMQVRHAVDRVIDDETIRIKQVTDQLVTGQIDLGAWQVQMVTILKSLHVAMAVAANGGIANSSSADLAYIGDQIKEQYSFLRNFSAQIATGEQALDGTLAARAAMYSQASRGMYENMRERQARLAGRRESRNVLGVSDHCRGENSCIEETKRGWVPIGQNVPVGHRRCMTNCRCSLEFR